MTVLKIYKMTFDYTHFGSGTLNESQITFDAGRLYSALFLEAVKLGVHQEFYQISNSENFALSDAFPYISGQPALPKPIGYPKHREKATVDLKKVRQEAKKVKKIQYVPASQFKDYIEHQANIDMLSATQKELAVEQIQTKKGEDPYEVSATFLTVPLYVIAEESNLFNQLMESLQDTGIGGKKSSGYGQFKLEILDVPANMQQRLTNNGSGKVMLLTTSLPNDVELEATLNGAAYLLKKSSGFVYSETVDELLRKQDLYKFKSGSTFDRCFVGSIRDVRPDQFPHPVWNYSRGLFYQLS